MKYLYSQLDPRWANQKVGNSGKNLGQIGCLLTDIAIIISDLMGDENTPEELLLWMNINNGFTPTGELKWETLLKYPIDKIGFHQGKALEGETQYEIYAVWAGSIKHWILKDGDKWIDPLKGAYISKNYYGFQGDVRLLAGKKIQSMNMDKFNRVKEKFIGKFNNPSTIPYTTKRLDGSTQRNIIRLKDGQIIEKNDVSIEEWIAAFSVWD